MKDNKNLNELTNEVTQKPEALSESLLENVIGGASHSDYIVAMNDIKREQYNRWKKRFPNIMPNCPPADADLMEKLGHMMVEVWDDADLSLDQKKDLDERIRQMEDYFNPLLR